MSNIVDKVFDNSADNDGKPNYAIQLVDGTRLYCRGEILNPLPKSGDAIDFTVINVKTSSKGNPYTNVKNVKIADNHTLDDNLPTGNNDAQTRQRMDIFVTGVVGRSMGSGHFQVHDIAALTKNAVKAFNENLKDI